MPILDLQQRDRELGRIRIGRKSGGDKGHPQKLDKFRFTSDSEQRIAAIAALYGGEPKPWNNDGKAEFEVYSTVDKVPILLPPLVEDEEGPITQWYEMWSGGGCQRRCNGRLNILTDTPCACPSDGLERSLLAAKGRACKPTTRLNVVLRDVPGIGVWRLESHGLHAAMQLPRIALFLAQATASGVYLPAVLGLSKMSSKRPGEGKREWITPFIDVQETPAALMAGGTTPMAIGAQGPERAAITASASEPDYVKLASAATDLDGWREVWTLASNNGDLGPQLKTELTAIGKRLNAADSDTPPADDEPVDAEIVDDEVDREYAAVIDNCPDGWDMSRLNVEFAQRYGGTTLNSGTAAELRMFKVWLVGGAK